MAIDRTYIFNKVNFFLKKENKFFTSSELQTTIGIDSFRRIASDLEFPKSNYSSPVSSGVFTVPMPTDFIKVDKTKDITFQDTTRVRKLTPKDQRRIGRDNILSAIPGSPENYFMEDQTTLGIYPPSTSGVIVVPYIQQPVSLSSDASTNALTEKGYMAVVYWTVSECMLKDNDTRYAVYEGLYNKEIARLRKEMGELYEEEKSMIPDSQYTRR